MDLEGYILLAALVLGLASFWSSARGHLSGVLLALPAAIAGVMILVAILRAGTRAMPATMLISLVYVAVGLASILLCWARRTERPERWD